VIPVGKELKEKKGEVTRTSGQETEMAVSQLPTGERERKAPSAHIRGAESRKTPIEHRPFKEKSRIGRLIKGSAKARGREKEPSYGKWEWEQFRLVQKDVNKNRPNLKIDRDFRDAGGG